MKINKLEKLDLTLYSETLDNGLRVFIVPKEDTNGIYVTLSTKFGSINDEFIPIDKNKMVKVPLGVAHFLEHKMFEQQDGKDPFSFYSERGCDANANTSNIKTTYLFMGPSNVDENLNYLLDYVQAPYFTDENVEKEKGIIEQEIKMYEDDPYFKIYDGIVYNSFIKHPIKYPIAGKVEDVYSITKEDLYTCYNTFYHPSNMFLVVTGNVDPQEIIDVVKTNQNSKKFKPFKKIKLKEYDEPNKVEKKLEHVKMDIEIPKASIAYKIDCSKFKKNIYDIKTYFSILTDIKFGSTSLINEKLKDLKLITSDIDVTLLNTDKHILIILTVESENYKKALKMLEEELNDLKIEEEDFERKIKVRKSGFIFRSDNIYSMNNKLVSNIMCYDEIILDDYKKIEEFNYKYLNKITNNLDLTNKTTYIITKS